MENIDAFHFERAQTLNCNASHVDGNEIENNI